MPLHPIPRHPGYLPCLHCGELARVGVVCPCQAPPLVLPQAVRLLVYLAMGVFCAVSWWGVWTVVMFLLSSVGGA